LEEECLLKVEHITVHYGKAIALDDVSLEIADGAAVSIIGANGAGKTTLLRAISGLTSLSAGGIRFRDTRLDRLTTAEIVKLGIVHIPEGRKLFPFLTVLNNLSLGATLRRNKNEINDSLEEVYSLFPILRERRRQKAGTLSGGEQQMLAIARGLMARPKLLLRDEPSVGLAPKIVEELGQVIKEINRTGVSVLLVEQNVPLALAVAEMAYVLQVGRVVMKGDIEKIKSAEIVKSAYLGG
jgi:branched-chain amino acid transport system ATP-binding protein